jgi:hypothetical protein
LWLGHRALTKFLWLSVTFDTQLYVWEDSVNRTIKFCNARNDGFMKKFEGSWTVQPFSSTTIGQAFGLQSAGHSQHSHSWHNPLSAFHKGAGCFCPGVSCLACREKCQQQWPVWSYYVGLFSVCVGCHAHIGCRARHGLAWSLGGDAGMLHVSYCAEGVPLWSSKSILNIVYVCTTYKSLVHHSHSCFRS